MNWIRASKGTLDLYDDGVLVATVRSRRMRELRDFRKGNKPRPLIAKRRIIEIAFADGRESTARTIDAAIARAELKGGKDYGRLAENAEAGA